ncbi:AAA family ATPase [Piscinibacter sp. XHJ-5]|uniref:AAA family ATPase n=1 Tax=Piscinibacter sp. XHJ-5 TaxID=3037797 RepID=UPI0024537139|nr:AAA family ATPase [Piscinibacter sp. XHJ-5]
MKIRIVTPVPAHAEAWTAALQRAERSYDVVAYGQSLHQVNALVNGSRPDLVIAEAASARDLDALERLANADPDIDFLLIAGDLSSDSLLRAMRAGVREVLPAPAEGEAVAAAVERLARKRLPFASAPGASSNGELLGFVSCKGGSGATFVAANLAHLLARNGERRVALIDLNLQFGDAALFVTNERASSNFAEVARNVHRLDRDLLQSAMTQAAPGLWVLPAPDDPAQAADVTPEHVKAVLTLASTMFDYVVIDIGRTINSVTLRALDACQRIYVVLQLTLPFIRDGKRLREVFRSLDYNANKVQWLVNRHQKGSEISLDDLKRTLGVEELATLPNQYDVVASSVNQGVPVGRLAPASHITRALRELAETIEPAASSPRSGRWLSSLFRGNAH